MPIRATSVMTFRVGPNVSRLTRCRTGSSTSAVGTVTFVAWAAIAGLEKRRPPAGMLPRSASPAFEAMYDSFCSVYVRTVLGCCPPGRPGLPSLAASAAGS
jgi:hypothetical protein